MGALSTPPAPHILRRRSRSTTNPISTIHPATLPVGWITLYPFINQNFKCPKDRTCRPQRQSNKNFSHYMLMYSMYSSSTSPICTTSISLEQCSKPWLVGWYRGLYYPIIWGFYFFKNIRIPINQSVFHGMSYIIVLNAAHLGCFFPKHLMFVLQKKIFERSERSKVGALGFLWPSWEVQRSALCRGQNAGCKVSLQVEWIQWLDTKPLKICMAFRRMLHDGYSFKARRICMICFDVMMIFWWIILWWYDDFRFDGRVYFSVFFVIGGKEGAYFWESERVVYLHLWGWTEYTRSQVENNLHVEVVNQKLLYHISSNLVVSDVA